MVALRTGEPVRGVVMGVVQRLDRRVPLDQRQRRSRSSARGTAGPHQVHCVFEDITERKRSEEALRRSEQRYRSLVDATSSIVWTTDGRGLDRGGDPLLGGVHRPGIAEYAGWGWLDAIHPLDRDRAADGLETVAGRRRSPYEVEYRLLRRDGEYRQVIARGVPVLDTGGALREWVGTCEDVTEQRKAEASLRQAKEEAERASGAKDEFIAVLSHELRTPLTPVLLTASMMEAHPGPARPSSARMSP